MKTLRILLLEDSADDAFLIEHELERSKMVFILHCARNRPEFERALADFNADVILCDHALPDINSIEAFAMHRARQKQTGVSIPFIVVTGHLSDEFAVQTLKTGVDGCIIKNCLKRLPMAISDAVEKCGVDSQ